MDYEIFLSLTHCFYYLNTYASQLVLWEGYFVLERTSITKFVDYEYILLLDDNFNHFDNIFMSKFRENTHLAL